jgi:hypothetical protein
MGPVVRFSALVLPVFACLGSTPNYAGAQEGAADVAAEPRTTGWLPFEFFRERWIFLHGMVNGVGTDLLLDSGAGFTVIERAEARRRGFRAGRRINALGVGGFQEGRLHGGVFIELDGLRLPNQRIASIDLAEIGRQVGRDIPLILGRAAFEAAVVDLDYPGRRVAFRDFESYAYAGPGMTLPLVEFGSGKWAVELDIEGRDKGLFQIDTGSGETLTLFEHFVEKNELLADRSTSVHLTGGVGGTLEVRTGTLASVSLGGVTFEGVPASFHAGDTGVFAALDLAGNLGSGILGRFRLVFDTRRQELHLELGEDGHRPFQRDRSGLQIVWTEQGLEVLHVAPGSPAAAAGWQAGARIAAVDGRPIGPDYWTALAGWNRKPAGTTVVLLDGDGVEHELVLAEYF